MNDVHSRLERRRHGSAALALALVRGDRVRLLQRQRDVVEAVEQAVAHVLVDLERRRRGRRSGPRAPRGRSPPHQPPSAPRRPPRAGPPGAGPIFVQLEKKMSAKLAATTALEAVVLERPRRVLAARAAAEVRAGDEDRVRRQIEAGLLAPLVEEELAEPGALDALEELRGDDLVGVDVGAVEHADGAADERIGSIASSSSGCRRSDPRSPPRRPSAARRDAYGRRGPGGPRSCGSTSRRSARRG